MVLNGANSPAVNVLKENFSETLLFGENDSVRFFESANEEYAALYNGAGILDVSNSGIIELRGSEALDFLNRISTNSLKNLNLFESVKTIFTTEKGRILDLADVIHLDDRVMLFCSGAFYNKLLAWINRYIIMEEIKVEGASGKYLVLDFIGSQSVSFLSMISGFKQEEIDSPFIHKNSIGGSEVILMRIKDLNGVNKFRIIAKAEESGKVIDFILSNKSAFDVRFIGSDAYEAFRIEYAIPKAPVELNDLYNPHEARLIDYVSFTKGCYIGQEVIARLDTYNKVQRLLVKLEINKTDNPQTNDIIVDYKGNEIGVLTSVSPAGLLENRIALGYIKRTDLENSEEFIIKRDEKTYLARVVNMPERL